MGLTENIGLWTFSLVLGVVGIIFGIIASWNSHKANQAVKDLIASSWIADESEKIFFKNLKSLIHANNRTLSMLKVPTTYKNYSIVANGTRFSPINTRSSTMLLNTEYKEILVKYKENKMELESEFSNIIESFKMLSSSNKIKPAKRKELIEYHKKISRVTSQMIKDYTNLMHHEE